MNCGCDSPVASTRSIIQDSATLLQLPSTDLSPPLCAEIAAHVLSANLFYAPLMNHWSTAHLSLCLDDVCGDYLQDVWFTPTVPRAPDPAAFGTAYFHKQTVRTRNIHVTCERSHAVCMHVYLLIYPNVHVPESGI